MYLSSGSKNTDRRARPRPPGRPCRPARCATSSVPSARSPRARAPRVPARRTRRGSFRPDRPATRGRHSRRRRRSTRRGPASRHQTNGDVGANTERRGGPEHEPAVVVDRQPLGLALQEVRLGGHAPEPRGGRVDDDKRSCGEQAGEKRPEHATIHAQVPFERRIMGGGSRAGASASGGPRRPDPSGSPTRRGWRTGAAGWTMCRDRPA